jgi:predicted transcriptional regulator
MLKESHFFQLSSAILAICKSQIMRKFNGLRAQDVVLLLKLVAYPHRTWLGKDLAQTLQLSASEVSEALAVALASYWRRTRTP